MRKRQRKKNAKNSWRRAWKSVNKKRTRKLLSSALLTGEIGSLSGCRLIHHGSSLKQRYHLDGVCGAYCDYLKDTRCEFLNKELVVEEGCRIAECGPLDENLIVVTREEHAEIHRLMKNPPEPNEAMLCAMSRRKLLLGQEEGNVGENNA